MEDTPLDIELIINSGPPIKWFQGFGYKEQGLMQVTTNDDFKIIIGEVGYSAWLKYCHYIGSPVDEKNTSEEIEAANNALAFGKKIIVELTGYDPDQIIDKEDLLKKAFKGKLTAPFEVELY